MNSPVIKPTVGRVLYFYPSANTAEAGFARHANGDGPYAALIAHVWNDGLVNLSVFDANGAAHPRTSVPLWQDPLQEIPQGAFCGWMPYQKGQAAKTEAAEKGAAEAPASPQYRQPSQRDQLECALVSGAAAHLATVPRAADEIAAGIKLVLDVLHPRDPSPYPLESVIQVSATGEAVMNFGQAIEAIKAGKRVARTGWNGRGMFVYLVPPASYPVQTGAAKAHFGEGAMVPYNAYMAIKNVDGTVSTWVPSVNDCLATDWSIAGEGAKVAERFSAPMMADGSAADPEKFGVVAIDALPVIDPGPDSLERAHAGTHASAVLYPAIERAMAELESLHPGFNFAVNRAFNHLHDAFWSQCPAPASAATKRPVQAA